MDTLEAFNNIIPVSWLLTGVVSAILVIAKFLFTLWYKDESLNNKVTELENRINENSEKDLERYENLIRQLNDLSDNYDNLDESLKDQNNILIELKTMVKLLVDNRISQPNHTSNANRSYKK